MFQRLPVASIALGELFAGGTMFTVPAFQRPFEWGATEALQLLDDVSRAAGIEAPEFADPDYFLGSVLLLADDGVGLPGTSPGGTSPADTSPANMTRVQYQVIDGQQRLTTLTILFAALRDLAPPNSEAAERLARLIAVADQPATREVRLMATHRLTLNGRDRVFFQRYVQKPGGTLQRLSDDAEEVGVFASQILEARDALMSALVEFDAEQRDALATFLVADCHIVVTLSHDIDRAHRLFTVLNERGKPLRRNDILKVEVLGGLASADGEYAHRMWEAAERTLGADFDTFFSHLKSVHGKRATSVVTGLRSLIAEVGGPRAFIDDVLTPYVKIHARIAACRQAPVPHHDPLAIHLFYLGRLRGEDWVPAAMVAMRVHENDPAAALSLIRGIDRIAYLTRVLCQGSGRRATRFSRILRAIRSGEAKDETAPVFALKNEEIRTLKFNLRDLHRRNQPICKLLLLRVNDGIEGNISLLDPATLSVEHVLPMRPAAASGWRILFVEPDLRELATESLGNLTLLPGRVNDRIRNFDFPDKRALMETFSEECPSLAITRDVIGSQAWDLPTIQAREQRFLSILSGILGIDVADAVMDLRRKPPEVAE